ncbi:MAG TPA: PEGA domain-containing protein [Patescibacteria group bacterium]|nr:PEGA domain-containing protein [Patescibacteria group bacterium]
MYRRRSKRTQRLFFFLTYTLVPLLIVCLVGILVLLIQGYRFNPSNNKVYQAGLVQFDTTPGGATVTVDGAKLGSKTSTRINVSSGRRTITMSRDGYTPWKKTVNVEAGSVLWLTYARLVPQTVSLQDVYSYPSIAASLVNRDQHLFGIQPSRGTPTFVTVPATSGTPSRQSATIPSSAYTAAAKSTFVANEWGKSGRYILFRHDISSKPEWLLLDRNNPADSINISKLAGLPISSAFFDHSDDRYVYVLSGGALRRFDRNTQKVSGILASNVLKFTQSSEGTLLIISSDTKDKAQTNTNVSYVTHGADSARSVSFADAHSDVVRSAAIVTYDRRQYISFLEGTNLRIGRTDIGSSNDPKPLMLTSAVELDVPKTVNSLESSPNGRFVVLRASKDLYTYDLELSKLSHVLLTSPTAPLHWLDAYHLAERRKDGKLTMIEFDGGNQTILTAVAERDDAVLSDNDRFLYLLQNDSKGYTLKRAQLIL